MILALCEPSLSVVLITLFGLYVFKRFQQFYTLAWTTLKIQSQVDDRTIERNTNVLAVAGESAQSSRFTDGFLYSWTLDNFK